MATAALPLFHLYGDPPDDQAFDFIHIETIASRSSIHDWTIRAHRHRNLFQILLIEQGGGEMTFEAATIAFELPCAILMPATIAHGFRFRPAVTDGWVMSFTEDVAEAMGDRRGEALARLKALAAEPVVPLGDAERDRLSKLAVRAARGALPRSRRLPHRHARTARADRGRGGAAGRQSCARRHRAGRARADRRHRRCASQAGRGAFPKGAPARLLCRQAGDDGRPPQRSRPARDRRHRRPPDPPARADRSQAPAGLHQPSRSTRSPTISPSPTPPTSPASSASRPARRRTSSDRRGEGSGSSDKVKKGFPLPLQLRSATPHRDRR